MTDKRAMELRNKLLYLNRALAKETKRRKWYERMYNLAIGEVGRWRTQDSLRQ